jgi:VanZ family protein
MNVIKTPKNGSETKYLGFEHILNWFFHMFSSFRSKLKSCRQDFADEISGLKNSKIFFTAAILYGVLILYLSIAPNIENIRHLINMILVSVTKDILIASNLSFILKFPVHSKNFAEIQFIDFGHVGVYFVFGIFLYNAFVRSKNRILARYSAASAICIGTAYGTLNEIFQLYFPYRSSNIADVFSNLLGLVLSQLFLMIFIYVFKYFLNRKKRIGSVNN